MSNKAREEISARDRNKGEREGGRGTISRESERERDMENEREEEREMEVEGMIDRESE